MIQIAVIVLTALSLMLAIMAAGLAIIALGIIAVTIINIMRRTK